MKKILSIILSLTLLFSTFVSSAYADTGSASFNVTGAGADGKIKAGDTLRATISITPNSNSICTATIGGKFIKEKLKVTALSMPQRIGGVQTTVTDVGTANSTGYFSVTFSSQTNVEVSEAITIEADFEVLDTVTANESLNSLISFNEEEYEIADIEQSANLGPVPSTKKFDATGLVELTGAQAVTGITVPAKGQTPDTDTDTAPRNTTVQAIEWYDGEKKLESDETFKAEKAYTVKVTLQPEAGYVFATDVTGMINANSAEVTKSGDNIVLAYTFGALPAKEVQSIKITTPPTKTNYIEGQTFDPAGMEVEATYDDGTKGNVTEFTCTPSGELATSDTEITVSVEGKTTKQTISVAKKAIDKIAITKQPKKTVYEIGDSADWSGMEVTATYNDETTNVLTSDKYTVDGFDAATATESQTITVKAKEDAAKTDTFTIKIEKKTIAAADAFTFTPPIGLTYDKTAKTAAVEAKQPYDGTAKVEYFQGDTSIEQPQNVGTYDVFVSAEETNTYKAVPKTKIGEFKIAPKAITMTATVEEKAYDATNVATIKKGTLASDSVETGDSVQIAEESITGTFASKDVANGINVTTTNEFTLSGTDKDNYTLTQPTGLTGNITEADYTYTVAGTQNFKVGSGLTAIRVAPEHGTGVQDENVAGTLKWYSDSTRNTEATDNDLSAVPADSTVTLHWRFTATGANYTKTPKTGETVFTAKNKEDVSEAINVSKIAQIGKEFDNTPVVRSGEATVDGHNDITSFVYEWYKNDNTKLDTAPKDAGNYYLKVSVPDENDNYMGSKMINFAIAAKKIANPEQCAAVTYNGEAQTYGIVSNADYEVSGDTTQTDANTTGYEVTITLKDKTNTTWADGSTTDLVQKFIINKATITVKAIDRPIYTNGVVPDFTKGLVLGTDYTVTGLFGSDALGGTLTMTYQQNGVTATPDNKKEGSYDIVISGATAPNTGNYENDIVFQNGTLKITANPGSSGGYYPYTPTTPSKPYAPGLDSAKKDSNAALSAAVAGNKYDAAEQAEVKKIMDKAAADIKNAKTEAEVKAIQEAAEKELDQILTTEEKEIIAAVESVEKSDFKTKSKAVKRNGKKVIKLTWNVPEDVQFDGFEIYRSTKKNSGYGTEPFFTTTKTSYTNTKNLKAGKTYYYKVRAFVVINGEKVYTEYSLKAWRKA